MDSIYIYARHAPPAICAPSCPTTVKLSKDNFLTFHHTGSTCDSVSISKFHPIMPDPPVRKWSSTVRNFGVNQDVHEVFTDACSAMHLVQSGSTVMDSGCNHHTF